MDRKRGVLQSYMKKDRLRLLSIKIIFTFHSFSKSNTRSHHVHLPFPTRLPADVEDEKLNLLRGCNIGASCNSQIKIETESRYLLSSGVTATSHGCALLRTELLLIKPPTGGYIINEENPASFIALEIPPSIMN